MKLLVVGGGSGGHVTPAVAVIREVLKKNPKTKVEFWTDKKYYKNVVKITTELEVSWGEEETAEEETPHIPGTTINKSAPYIRVRKIHAGKFHRYHNMSAETYLGMGGKALRDVTFGNIGGFFGFTSGIIQAFFRMLKKSNRPDIIFLKGGYVGLPVGIIAKMFRIPYVIHESDATMGLANRTLAKKATVICTGTPFEEDEAHAKYVWTGIPVAKEFKEVSEARKKSLKKELGFDEDKPLVIVTGGSQGAANLNRAVSETITELLKFTSVGLVAGRKHYEEVIELKKYEEWDKAKLQSNFRLWEFSTEMDVLLGAADIVVTRAGATTIAELSALGKCIILVPYEKLPGDHQTKNAVRLSKIGAAEQINDHAVFEKPEKLLEIIRTLARSPKKRKEMSNKLHSEARSDAAKRLAEILIDVSEGKDITKK
ncbi:MAG: glycosyltransferase [Candidatus Saccharibacteria bacterium]|nr:glycosyltransferase [Candidatus Saccharibacteria bacterium]